MNFNTKDINRKIGPKFGEKDSNIKNGFKPKLYEDKINIVFISLLTVLMHHK